MLLFLLKLILFVIGLYVLLSQITFPILKDQPIFPIFRKARNDASDRLLQANATEEDLALEKKAVEKERALDSMKKAISNLVSKQPEEKEREKKDKE